MPEASHVKAQCMTGQAGQETHLKARAGRVLGTGGK